MDRDTFHTVFSNRRVCVIYLGLNITDFVLITFTLLYDLLRRNDEPESAVVVARVITFVLLGTAVMRVLLGFRRPAWDFEDDSPSQVFEKKLALLDAMLILTAFLFEFAEGSS
jgi:hypothetical protein